MVASSKSFVPRRLIFGTGGADGSRGIYFADWELSTGEIGSITLAAEVKSPSFLAIHRHGTEQFIYAVSEASGDDAKVTAYSTVAGEPGLHLLKCSASRW